jgi:hypothetical protein
MSHQFETRRAGGAAGSGISLLGSKGPDIKPPEIENQTLRETRALMLDPIQRDFLADWLRTAGMRALSPRPISNARIGASRNPTTM